MKFLRYIIAISIVLPLLNSCIKSNLDELPAYDESKITSVQCEYRYYGPNEWVDGNKVVEVKSLTRESQTINKEDLTVVCKFKVPAAGGSFTTAERDKVTLKNVACIFDISTAARITPLEGAPKLGVPGNWEGPKKYEVLAANGTKSVWTVTITLEK